MLEYSIIKGYKATNRLRRNIGGNLLGQIVAGKITDINQEAFFVQVKGITFRLDKNAVAQDERILELGDEVKGFIYEDREREMVMTQYYPRAQVDQYGWGTVTEVRKDLGVFVDIGLPEKDVVVSLDDLPLDYPKWPKAGDQLLVALEEDHKNRLWAKVADDAIFQQLAVKYPKGMEHKHLEVTVYASRFVGAFAVSKDYYLTFIHESQLLQTPRLGEVLDARVIGEGSHGRLNLSTLPQSFEVIDDDAQMIYMMLKRTADKTLPFADSSDAESIKQHFGISKSSFKRALGHLLKNKLIAQDKEKQEIRLISDVQPDEQSDEQTD